MFNKIKNAINSFYSFDNFAMGFGALIIIGLIALAGAILYYAWQVVLMAGIVTIFIMFLIHGLGLIVRKILTFFEVNY